MANTMKRAAKWLSDVLDNIVFVPGYGFTLTMVLAVALSIALFANGTFQQRRAVEMLGNAIRGSDSAAITALPGGAGAYARETRAGITKVRWTEVPNSPICREAIAAIAEDAGLVVVNGRIVKADHFPVDWTNVSRRCNEVLPDGVVREVQFWRNASGHPFSRDEAAHQPS